jgi:hypothetical protein
MENSDVTLSSKDVSAAFQAGQEVCIDVFIYTILNSHLYV